MLHLLFAAVLGASWIDDRARLAASLQQALVLFQAQRPKLEARLGKDQTIDLGMRLVTDRDYLNQPPPLWYTQQDWVETVETVSSVDVQSVRDAASIAAPALPTQTGLHEGFARSAIDGVWEPVAVYIPVHHAAHPPIAIVLHGRPQSETELLGQPYFRELADRTGTILVAPWGRGNYDFEGDAARDLDALASQAQSLYSGDPHALYLAGYSMGGFSVFKVGTTRSWSAVMCIAGALLNSEVPMVRFAWRDTPVYVVNGALDESIPAVYGTRSAIFMASQGIPTAFYQQPDGHHPVRTLMPVLQRAWLDMHAGVVRADTIPGNAVAGGFLPGVPAMHDADLKP